MQAKTPTWGQLDGPGSRASSTCLPAAAIREDELLPAVAEGGSGSGSHPPVGPNRAASSCGSGKPQEQSPSFNMGAAIAEDALTSFTVEDAAPAQAEDGAQGVAQRSRPKVKLSDHEFSLWLGPLPQRGKDKVVAICKALIERSITTVTDVYVPRRKDYGFIRFHCEEEAVRALEIFQGSPWRVGGVQVEVATAFEEKRNYGLPADAEISVKVGNLRRCTKQQLEQVLATHGIATHVDVSIPQGQPYGFVCFQTEEDAQRLLQQGPNMAFGGEPLTLEVCSNGRKNKPRPKPRP